MQLVSFMKQLLLCWVSPSCCTSHSASMTFTAGGSVVVAAAALLITYKRSQKSSAGGAWDGSAPMTGKPLSCCDVHWGGRIFTILFKKCLSGMREEPLPSGLKWKWSGATKWICFTSENGSPRTLGLRCWLWSHCNNGGSHVHISQASGVILVCKGILKKKQNNNNLLKSFYIQREMQDVSCLSHFYTEITYFSEV